MGRADKRNSPKMKRRRACASKKARELHKREGKATHTKVTVND